MNQMTPPPKIEIIPASAPFSEAQRSWLNGFFAGLLSPMAPTPLSAEQGAAVLQAATATTARRRGTTRPCRSPDRMKLAEGRPLRRQHDGGDGAAGLRPVRLQLQRLFRRDRDQGRSRGSISASPAARKPRGC